MPENTIRVDQATMDAINEIKSKMDRPTAASRVREVLAAWRIDEMMNSPMPMIIVTKDGQMRNYEAQRADLLQANLTNVLRREQIIADLQIKLDASDGTTGAYRTVVADMQNQIMKLRDELGNQDEVTRDRKTFVKLLRQIFSIKVGFVSINIDALTKIIQFPWSKR